MTDLKRMTEHLETLAKAKGSEADADTLAKALTDATAALTDVLEKSKDADEDDPEGEPDPDPDEEPEEDPEEERGEIRKALDQMFDPEVSEELVKSSEAFEALDLHNEARHDETQREIEDLKKSLDVQGRFLAAVFPVLLKKLDAFEETANLVKALPAAPAASRLGVGAAPAGEKPALSKALVADLLTKSIQDKKVDESNAAYLSLLTTRGADALPESLLRDIGAIE